MELGIYYLKPAVFWLAWYLEFTLKTLAKIFLIIVIAFINQKSDLANSAGREKKWNNNVVYILVRMIFEHCRCRQSFTVTST